MWRSEWKESKLLRSFKISFILLLRTEIWSFEDDDAVNMKIAEPTLTAYECYPILFVVPSDFCSNTRTSCHQNKSARAFSKKTRNKTFIVKSFIQSSKLNFCEWYFVKLSRKIRGKSACIAHSIKIAHSLKTLYDFDFDIPLHLWILPVFWLGICLVLV